jgi:hypothetical protein
VAAEKIARPKVVVEPHPGHPTASWARCEHGPWTYGPTAKVAAQDGAKRHRFDHRAGHVDLETGRWTR